MTLAAISTLSGGDETSLGIITLRLQVFSGTLCPIAFRFVARLALRACSMLEVGRLRGGGVGIPNAKQNDAPFAAVGGAEHWSWQTVETVSQARGRWGVTLPSASLHLHVRSRRFRDARSRWAWHARASILIAKCEARVIVLDPWWRLLVMWWQH